MTIGNVKSGSGPLRPEGGSSGRPVRADSPAPAASPASVRAAGAKSTDTPDVDVQLSGAGSEQLADSLGEDRLLEIKKRIASGHYKSNIVVEAIVEGYLKDFVLRRA